MSNGDKIREVFKERMDFDRNMAYYCISTGRSDGGRYWLTRASAMKAMLLGLESRGLLD